VQEEDRGRQAVARDLMVQIIRHAHIV
jgi:hypothetical protein